MRYLILVLMMVIAFSCKEELSIEDQSYIEYMENYRISKDSLMEFSPTSPFNKKGKVEFHPLKYFPVDLDYVFHSKLYEFENKDTISLAKDLL